MRHHNKGINKTGSNTAAQHTSNYIRGYKAVALVIRQRRRSRENMNEQNKIKVKDMTYSRIDIDDECEAFRRLTERVRTAKSGKELADIRSETIERTKHIRTMNSLCYIRFTMNTRDEYYLSEKTYYDENMPEVTIALDERLTPAQNWCPGAPLRRRGAFLRPQPKVAPLKAGIGGGSPGDLLK